MAGPERSAATMVATLGALRGLPGEVRRRVCEEAWWDLRSPQRTVLGGGSPRSGVAAAGSFASVAWSPDGRQLAAGSGSNWTEDGPGAISVWDVASGPAPTRACLRGGDHDPAVTGEDYDSDDENMVDLYRTGEPPCGCERTCALEEDEKLAFYCSAQGCSLPGHAQNVVALAFSPDGTTLMSASEDFTVRLWGRMSGPSDAWEQRVCLPAGEMPTAGGWSGMSPTHCAWSPDASRVLVCLKETEPGNQWRVQVWDVPGPGQPAPLRPSLERRMHGGMLGSADCWNPHVAAAFSPGGGTVVASDGWRLVAWELAADEETPLWPMEDVKRRVQGVCISPDASHVAAALGTPWSDCALVVWRVGEGGMERVREIRSVVRTLTDTLPLALSPDNHYLLVAGSQKSEMWSVQTGRKVWEDEHPEERSKANAVAFSPDGRSFAIASSRVPVEVWR